MKSQQFGRAIRACNSGSWCPRSCPTAHPITVFLPTHRTPSLARLISHILPYVVVSTSSIPVPSAQRATTCIFASPRQPRCVACAPTAPPPSVPLTRARLARAATSPSPARGNARLVLRENMARGKGAWWRRQRAGRSRIIFEACWIARPSFETLEASSSSKVEMKTCGILVG